MEKKLSQLQAFKIMQSFLEKYFERTRSDDVGSLLGDIQLIPNNTTRDPAAWNDWLDCVNSELSKDNL